MKNFDLRKYLAENKLLKENTNPIWTIDSFEDSADIEQAGPEYKEAVINIIKAKHPDITDKDLEESIEVMNVTWYNEARSNAKGSDPEEMEVSAEDFADGAMEHYEDVIVWDNNNKKTPNSGDNKPQSEKDDFFDAPFDEKLQWHFDNNRNLERLTPDLKADFLDYVKKYLRPSDASHKEIEDAIRMFYNKTPGDFI